MPEIPKNFHAIQYIADLLRKGQVVCVSVSVPGADKNGFAPEDTRTIITLEDLSKISRMDIEILSHDIPDEENKILGCKIIEESGVYFVSVIHKSGDVVNLPISHYQFSDLIK